jgi:hypothetical protein
MMALDAAGPSSGARGASGVSPAHNRSWARALRRPWRRPLGLKHGDDREKAPPLGDACGRQGGVGQLLNAALSVAPAFGF